MKEYGHILVIPSWYPPDGGNFFLEHSEALAASGWKVDVLVNRVVGIRKLLSAGIGAIRGMRTAQENNLRVTRAVYLKIPGSEPLNIRRWSKRTCKLYGKVEKRIGKPDLILAHSATWAGVAASMIRDRFAIPYLVVEHRSFFVWSTPEARQIVRPYYIPYLEQAYRSAERVVPVSGSLLKGLSELFPWIGPKVEVIPNMILEEMFLPPREDRRGDPFCFFWAGRLEHVKGLDVLLKAARQLKEQTTRNFTVRLAGRGSLRVGLEQQAEEEGVSGLVRFLGRISREQMQQEMQQASCFVLPTRYEAFGVVLIEAMATGLPVIATRSGGPDHIVGEEDGILVDPDEPGQLAEAMMQIMDRYGDYDPAVIRERCIRRFGHRAVMEQYRLLLTSIAGSR